MKRRFYILFKHLALFFAFIIFLGGCATHKKDRRVITGLKDELSIASGKLDLFKRENLNLKKELVLFKKAQDIDSHKFVKAQEVFERVLSDEITAKDVWVQMTERGLVIRVSAEKLFVSGTAALSDGGSALLDKTSGLIKEEFPLNYIYIEGHTDNQSLAIFEWKSDWDFSFARALSVLKYFTEKKHMDPLRFSASGFGQYRPTTSNDTREGRRLNRRVEIVISVQRPKSFSGGEEE